MPAVQSRQQHTLAMRAGHKGKGRIACQSTVGRAGRADVQHAQALKAGVACRVQTIGRVPVQGGLHFAPVRGGEGPGLGLQLGEGFGGKCQHGVLLC